MSFYCDIALAAELESSFPGVANMLGGHFHMDAYLSGSGRVLTDEEIFDEVRSMHNDDERIKLAKELEQLLTRNDASVVSLWNAKAHCHNYILEDAESTRALLCKLQRRLSSQI